MKSLVAELKKWFSVRNELAKANSYIKYLNSELKVQRDIAKQAVRESVGKDVEIMAMASELGAAHERVASGRERYFLKVCRDIYSNGKMISELRFRGMVGAMMGEGMPNTPDWGMSVDNGYKHPREFNK